MNVTPRFTLALVATAVALGMATGRDDGQPGASSAAPHVSVTPRTAVASTAFIHEKLTPLYFPNFFCSFLTGLGCPNCIDYFTSQGLQNIYHLQNLSIEVNALGRSVLTTCFYRLSI